LGMGLYALVHHPGWYIYIYIIIYIYILTPKFDGSSSFSQLTSYLVVKIIYIISLSFRSKPNHDIVGYISYPLKTYLQYIP
jgi:hypothetical protein